MHAWDTLNDALIEHVKQLMIVYCLNRIQTTKIRRINRLQKLINNSGAKHKEKS